MNTVPAKDLKRRGVVVLEEHLQRGPVHIIKNNRPTCVVLSEDDFLRLTQQRTTPIVPQASVFDLLAQPATGTRDRSEIDAEWQAERAAWDDA